MLEAVHEGMEIYDRDGKRIGTAERVHIGEVSTVARDRGMGPATVSSADQPRDTLLHDLAQVFNTDEVPEEVRERLLNNGFVRIDADGLFAQDRYVLPEQIERVSGDQVTLRVSRDELIRD